MWRIRIVKPCCIRVSAQFLCGHLISYWWVEVRKALPEIDQCLEIVKEMDFKPNRQNINLFAVLLLLSASRLILRSSWFVCDKVRACVSAYVPFTVNTSNYSIYDQLTFK